MQISSLNWQQVEAYLQKDDRCVLPIGSTEQHAFLSLATDSILAERMSRDAAAPLGIPVFPVMPYGCTPSFMDFPGTVSLRMETLASVLHDILDSLAAHGLKRILIVNGHGGNAPVITHMETWRAKNKDVRIKFHNWWRAPQTWIQVQKTDPVASHASWMENFPWTRLEGVSMPLHQKPMADLEGLDSLSPVGVRTVLGDGNYGGFYQRSDADTDFLWQVAVAETRALLESDWEKG